MELVPTSHWAVRQFCEDCFNQNIQFKVNEVYRPQSKQDYLWTIGRRGISGEKKVTWTKSSLHTSRQAFDITVINCTYEQVEGVGHIYGLYRPIELVKEYGDLGHFQCDKVVREPAVPTYSPAAIIRRLKRLINLSDSPLQKSRLMLRLEEFLSTHV